MLNFNDEPVGFLNEKFMDFFINTDTSRIEDQNIFKSNLTSSNMVDLEAGKGLGIETLFEKRRRSSRSAFHSMDMSEECSDDSFDIEDEIEFTKKEFDIDRVFEIMVPMLKRGEVELPVAVSVVKAAYSTFTQENAMIDLNFEGEIETVVVGDIHGQFQDLLLIFEKFGRPGPGRRYIFNGDIVDRGPRSVACLLLLFALKSVASDYLFITRGNHETRTINTLSSTFALECARNYSQLFYMECQRVFDEIPVAYTLNSSIFITHGGLPKDLCLNRLRKMSKLSLNSYFDRSTFMALLWNDPTSILGYGNNNRGPSVHTFGPDVTEKFLKQHNLKLLIRSHEYKPFGHEFTHRSKCLTIFSAPDYQKLGNTGAVALVDSLGNVRIEQFY